MQKTYLVGLSIINISMEKKFKVRLKSKRNNKTHILAYTLQDIVKGNTWDKEIYDHEIIGEFTGRLDKNGKEVYTGDVISSENYRMFGGKYPVEFDADLSMFITKLPGVTGNPLYKHHSIEVIGNIYEDPKLLESLSIYLAV